MGELKTITVVISDDGTMEFDLDGYVGKQCEGALKKLISEIGDESKVVQKPEFYIEEKVQIENKF